VDGVIGAAEFRLNQEELAEIDRFRSQPTPLRSRVGN
jgi:hypothetical protein